MRCHSQAVAWVYVMMDGVAEVQPEQSGAVLLARSGWVVVASNAAPFCRF
jgi:hypothetical protein